MSADADHREEIRAIIASGLRTESQPRADTHDMVQAIIGRLQMSDGNLTTKLIISGITLNAVVHGDIEQICETCMYYKVHRKYCELPELALPVEPTWSCRLWRI